MQKLRQKAKFLAVWQVQKAVNLNLVEEKD
jgi:hypothetical protein